jgi:ribonuclease HII
MPSRKRSTPEQLALPWARPGLAAGVDEAGRGPLAGPVVAAAVILDDHEPIPGLADSKALTPTQRERLEARIMASALCVGVGEASVEEIDTLNILQATMLAMQRAVQRLRLRPLRVLVDGNRLPVLPVAAEAIVGGDAKVPAISAASIVAGTGCASSSTANGPSTALPRTRVTARPDICRHSRSTGPARRTVAASHRCNVCWAYRCLRWPGRRRGDARPELGPEPVAAARAPAGP